jgi:hypothetical protein
MILIFMASLFIMMFLVSLIPTNDSRQIFADIINEEEPILKKNMKEAAITASAQYNISDYTVYNGTYVSGIGNMNVSDATNATFIEAKYTGPTTDSNITVHSDNVTKWSIDGNFGTLIRDTAQDYDGDGYSIRASTTSSTGDARFIYDNGTTKTMGLDVSDMVKLNYTVRTEAVSNQIAFSIIRLHNSDTKYYTETFDINLLQDTWHVFENTYATVTSVGGMTSADSVNWIEWIFTPIKNDKKIWIDAGTFFSQTAGVDQRLLNTSLQFSGIADFDHYVCNISAYRSCDTDYNDDFFSEDHVDWGSDASVTMSRDTTDVQLGTYRMIATYDASANATFWFDNQTSKNMQVDWTNYSLMGQTVWGNASFIIDYGRFYTDTSNYYHADVGVTYGTTPTELEVPYSVFTEIGSPSWDNISWIEWKINNIDNPNPVEVYFDHLYQSTGGKIYFDSTSEIDAVEQSLGHAHTYLNFTVTLNATEIQTNGYVNITLNDAKRADDLTNTTVYIDLLQITAWNETNTYPVIDTELLCHNLDDTDNIYGRYKTYIFTVNVSDADGYADIHYVNVSTDIGTTTYNNTADTFTDDSEYWEIDQTASSAVKSGIYCNITCGTILYLVPGLSAINVEFSVLVIDDSGATDSEIYYTTWDFTSELACANLTISDDRGNAGQELYVTGNLYYADSPTYARPPSTWVDMWATGDISNKVDTTIGADGDFNITGIESSSTAGLNTYTIRSVRNGTGAAGGCLCLVCATKTYISDRIVITLSSENVFEYKNGGPATIAILATYEYDGATVTSYSMTFSEDGDALSGTYTQADPFYKPIRYGVTSTFTTNTFTDTTYGITSFTSDSLTIKWVGTDPDKPPATGETPEPDIEPDVFGGGGVGWILFGIFIMGIGYVGIYGYGQYKGIQEIQLMFNNLGKWIKGRFKLFARSGKGSFGSIGRLGKSSGSKIKKVPSHKNWKFGGWKLGGWKLKRKSDLPRGNVKGSGRKTRRGKNK